MMVTHEEERKRIEIRSQVHEGTQAVLRTLESYDRSVRSIILDSIEKELVVRATAQDAVHHPVAYAEMQDDSPRPELPELPEFGQV